jgi:RNA recognition motif-containing protein
VTNTDLETMFAPHGTAQSAQVIMDRDTGRSKGFGFVEMGNNNEAQAAITALNGKESDGRALTVNEARPREDRGGSRSGSSGGGKRY